MTGTSVQPGIVTKTSIPGDLLGDSELVWPGCWRAACAGKAAFLPIGFATAGDPGTMPAGTSVGKQLWWNFCCHHDG